jgi:hypothetical protein
MANATNQSSTRSHHPDRPAIELPIVAPSGIASQKATDFVSATWGTITLFATVLRFHWPAHFDPSASLVSIW